MAPVSATLAVSSYRAIYPHIRRRALGFRRDGSGEIWRQSTSGKCEMHMKRRVKEPFHGTGIPLRTHTSLRGQLRFQAYPLGASISTQTRNLYLRRPLNRQPNYPLSVLLNLRRRQEGFLTERYRQDRLCRGVSRRLR